MFDYQPRDVFACIADLSWITGHSYVVYGPLCNGATTVLFESTATYPHAGMLGSSITKLVHTDDILTTYISVYIYRTLLGYGGPASN